MNLFWKTVRAVFNNFDHPQHSDFSQKFSRVLRTLSLEVFFKESSEKYNKFHGSFKSISTFLSRKRRFLCLRPDKRVLCSDFFAPFREHEASLRRNKI